MKIEILSQTGFNFLGNYFNKITLVKCEVCEDDYLSNGYVEIVDELKRKELLPNGFKMMCCWCYLLLKYLGYTKCPFCGEHLTVQQDIDFYKNIKILDFVCYNCSKTIAVGYDDCL